MPDVLSGLARPANGTVGYFDLTASCRTKPMCICCSRCVLPTLKSCVTLAVFGPPSLQSKYIRNAGSSLPRGWSISMVKRRGRSWVGSSEASRALHIAVERRPSGNSGMLGKKACDFANMRPGSSRWLAHIPFDDGSEAPGTALRVLCPCDRHHRDSNNRTTVP